MLTNAREAGRRLIDALRKTDLNPEWRAFCLVTIARCLTLLAFIFRCNSHREELKHDPFGVPTLYLAIFFAALFLVWLLFSTVFSIKESLLNNSAYTRVALGEAHLISKSFARCIVYLDSAIFSAFYLITLEPESDFFLFFLVVIFTASVFLQHKEVLALVLPLQLVLLAVVLLVIRFHLPDNDSNPKHFHGSSGLQRLLVNVFALRGIAIFGAAALSTMLVDSLRSNRDLYVSVLRHLRVVLWRKDSNHRFTYVNRAFLDRTSRWYSQVIGSTDYDLFPKEFADRFRNDDMRVLSDGQPVTNPREPFILQNGTIVYNYVSKVAVLDINKTPIGTQGFFIDMTREQLAYNDALTVATAATHASRIKHELENQIVTIRANALSIFEHIRDGSAKDALKFVEHIESTVSVMERRLDELAKRRRRKRKNTYFDLNLLVEETVARNRAQVSCFAFKLECSGNLPTLLADRDDVIEAVRNMLFNAKEAIMTYVRTNRGKHPSQCTLLVVTEAGRNQEEVAIRMTNSGTIGADALDKINRGINYSTKFESSEHGLGIPIIRTCAHNHSGEFLIEAPAKEIVVSTLILRAYNPIPDQQTYANTTNQTS